MTQGHLMIHYTTELPLFKQQVAWSQSRFPIMDTQIEELIGSRRQFVCSALFFDHVQN